MFEQLFFNVIVKIAQLPKHYTTKNRFRTGNNKHDFLNKNYKKDFYPFVPSFFECHFGFNLLKFVIDFVFVSVLLRIHGFQIIDLRFL
jgi:hypothetical protein